MPSTVAGFIPMDRPVRSEVPVFKHTDELAHEIEAIAETVGRLEDRLDPVAHPPEPDANQLEGATPRIVMSEHADRLRQLGEDLQSVRMRVERLMARLEI